jgi:hypothetical protein
VLKTSFNLAKKALGLAGPVPWSNNTVFPIQGSLIDTDYIVGLHGATNAKWTASVILNYFNSNAQISEGQVTDLISDLAAKLNIGGGALTGPVTAAADPTVPLGLATKQYVDNSVSSDTFQDVYNNSSPPEFAVSASGFTILDPSSTPLFDLGTSDGINFYAQLQAQAGVSLVSLTDGSFTSFTSGNILNHFHGDAGANNPNFTFTAQSEIPSSFFSNCGGYQFGFSDESSSPSGFFQLNLADGGLNNAIFYASGAAAGNPALTTINSQVRIGPSFTPVSSNCKLLIRGTASSGTDAASIGLFTDLDGYPVMQLLGMNHTVGAINFNCYSQGGTFRSSSATANFSILQSSTQLQFLYQSGVTPGSGFGFAQGLILDTTGYVTCVTGAIAGLPSVTTKAVLQANSITKGFMPPVWTSSQESTNIATLGSGDIGLQWFNSTLATNDCWDGLSVQHSLTIENCIEGTNMTLDTTTYPGKIIFSSSGGSSSGVQVQGSFSSGQSTTPTSVTTTDSPINIGSASFIVVNSVGTSVAKASVSGVTTPIIQNTSVGGRWGIARYDLTINFQTSGTTTLLFTVYTNTGATLFSKSFTTTYSAGTNQQFSFSSPVVYLNTNDYMYLAVSCFTGTVTIYSAGMSGSWVDTTTASLPNTNALVQGSNNLWLSQNGGTSYQFLSGSATVGNLAAFNSTGGQLIDSGIVASTVLTNTNQVVAITVVTGNVLTLVDSAPVNRYVLQNSALCTLILPTSITAGHSFEIIGGRLAGWVIEQNAGQSIALGNQTTTVGTGGSLASSYSTDSLILGCTTANTQLTAYAVQGNITFI